ncbi:MAG: DUF4129 domain-containing protein, partial [Pyrinomonadaceae bacterium]
FHGGEYNDTVEMTIVRQRNAHAWVEVYFPGEKAWITFDPTPVRGDGSGGATAGILGTVNKYLEALDTFWVQYFVAYDDQEQRSMARNVRSGFLDYQASISGFLGQTRDAVAEWLTEVRGDKGMQASRRAVGYALAYAAGGSVLLIVIFLGLRKILRSSWWAGLWGRHLRRPHRSVVEFYARMLQILADRGLYRSPDQTPLEFASVIGIPEVVSVTERYNRVRFGAVPLTRAEADEMEKWLNELKTGGSLRAAGHPGS